MASRIPTIYLGIASNDSCTKVALAFHDGHFNLDSCIVDLSDGTVMSMLELSNLSPLSLTDGEARGHCRCLPNDPNVVPIGVTYIVNAICEHTMKIKCKILAAGIDSACSFRNHLCHSLWNDFDILPFMFSLNGGLEERADSASRKVVMQFGPDRMPRLSISYRNTVEVDNGCINMVQLSDYEATVSKQTWKVLTQLSTELKNKNVRIAFFNATPQGGGVALMRHALIRMLKIIDFSATWHVPKPSPAVFRITKNNHNMFQGVAGPEMALTDESIAVYEAWVKANCERYWVDGPFQWADVIVLDDPQVAGYIPYIKKVNPSCKIIYRSHIEIRSDLCMDPTKPQFKLWQYYWNFIFQADYFISHPIPGFVPSSVPSNKVLMMPACTDPLDGLNKPMSDQDCLYWIHALNRFSFDQTGNRLHYPRRPYICQIARFDPSKGYIDVLDSYLILRENMDNDYPLSKIPQLALCGHGSVDDPDGALIYQTLIDKINSPEFELVKSDICIVRVPPEDRILNALLRCARVALQLSHREGFEVKVTESLHKGTPIIVYNAGGIPLQLPPKYKYIVNVGDVSLVADHLLELCTDNAVHKQVSENIKQWGSKEEFWTVWQTINWLWITKLSMDKEEPIVETNHEGKFRYVKDGWKARYAAENGDENIWNDVLN